jgi:hypothetical protein
VSGVSENDLFQSLVGEPLSAVVFILDYWQFQFAPATISALTRIEVRDAESVTRDGEDQFRNRLCGLIGKTVARVALRREAITFTFEDESSFSISLRLSDYRGPEAAIFISARSGIRSVIRTDTIFPE